MSSKFYTKRGLLTRYSFACGYVEKKDGLTLHMEHGVYHVRGFRDNCRIMSSFAHVHEARKFMNHPFTHKPSDNGWMSITKQE